MIDLIWLLRHGESAGNVARDKAEFGGLAMIDIADRDMDVPLSSRGEEQAVAVGRWFADIEPDRRPTIALTSPYVRAVATTTLALEAAGLDSVPVVVDERLREPEFGVLGRLTQLGTKA